MLRIARGPLPGDIKLALTTNGSLAIPRIANGRNLPPPSALKLVYAVKAYRGGKSLSYDKPFKALS